MKTALITGITGQDGSYLSDMLLSFGYYDVHGLVRPNNSADRFETLEKIRKKGIRLHTADICDIPALVEILYEIEPDEIYHFAAQSHVGLSFKIPEYSLRVNGEGTSSLFTAVLQAFGSKSNCRIYNAATSELFGDSPPPQEEYTVFSPRSPYAIGKLSAYFSTVGFRNKGGIAVNGILFNHESPRRGYQFVTRKIVRQLAEIKAGEREFIELGNLSAKRDWGYAAEYVRAAFEMLQDGTQDFVVGTGKSHTVGDFLNFACEYVQIKNTKEIVRTDISNIRPSEVEYLEANPRKIFNELGWCSNFDLKSLIRLMVDSEFRKMELSYPGLGFESVRKLAKQCESQYSWVMQAEGLE